MTNYELGEKLGRLVREERRITNEILLLINLAQERRSYLELGFNSMFDWMVRGFGYSNAAAYRRIEAAKLLRAVPKASEKLESGELNLSAMSKAQTAIRNQEKATGTKISPAEKNEIIQKIKNKSGHEVDQTLMALLPENQSQVHKDKHVVINESTIRYSMNFTLQIIANLKRAKEILSHKFPQGSDAEVIGYALDFLLEHLDPLRKVTSAAEAKCVTKTATRRMVYQSTNGTCSYQDPVTGQMCKSRYQVEIDHELPRAFGGDNSRKNLRPMCRAHNILMAERIFGREHMNKFRRAR